MMRKGSKIAVIIILVLLAGAIIAAGIFFFRNKEFSFQKLKRNDIKEIAFNTVDDFYYILNEKETDVIYEELRELVWEDSGIDDVAPQNEVKIRLTLKNGDKISFQGSGHTLVMEDKAYYIEENTVDNIRKICNTWWEALQKENESRKDFSDIKVETVREVKVYEGVSLSYTLNKEEKNEVLTSLNALKPKVSQEAADGNAGRRYQIKKEDGTVLEFSVDAAVLSMNGKAFSIPEKDGKALKEKQEKWLQKVREETRQMPFKDFKAVTIKSIEANSLWFGPKELGEEEKREFLDVLCQITIAGKGTEDYIRREGLITDAFRIEKADGTKITISASQDPFVMDGKGYVIEDEQLAGKLSEMYQKFVPQGQ